MKPRLSASGERLVDIEASVTGLGELSSCSTGSNTKLCTLYTSTLALRYVSRKTDTFFCEKEKFSVIVIVIFKTGSPRTYP